MERVRTPKGTSRRSFQNPTDDEIRDLLRRVRTIAVVGLSPQPHRPSYRVASYLIGCGYIVFGVRPDGDEVLGRPCYPTLADVPEAVDLVDVFRHPRHLPQHTDEAIAVGVPALWFQLGVVDEASALRAQDAGITVVMNRCLMVEHGRLIGA